MKGAVMKSINELALLADKVINLINIMNDAYGDTYKEDHTRLAIMAGLRDMESLTIRSIDEGNLEGK